MFWAPITWIFIHAFSYRVNEEYYNNNKNVCFNIIIYICSNLPCPVCRNHAIAYLKTNNIRICNTKEKFKKYLWYFHNSVNKMLKKQQFSYESFDQLYKRSNFNKICFLFLKEFQRPYYYGSTMDSWQRRNVSKNIETYLRANRKQYNI